ncbi:MAG TPA: PLP-dependent aminotransferase family protein [Thermoanaerobaculia bacterium]|nr:PLP-dependent aminotransferase family protein [Thermoanaerobaculia bacterium]
MNIIDLFQTTNPDLPAWKRISYGIEHAVADGAIAIGMRLPSERTLARQLGKSRTTVVAAYDDLQMKGIIRRYVGRGSFIAGGIETPNAPFAWAGKIARGFHAAPDYETAFSSPLPHDDLSAAIGHVIRCRRYEPAPVEGEPKLREAIADYAGCAPDEVLVTNGVQQSLDLVARYLLDPKDTVIVEQPGHTGAFQAFRTSRAQLVGWNAPAWNIAELQHLIVRHKPKLIYTNPTFHNPTGATMSIETRREFLATAAVLAVPVIEDDTYSKLHWNRQAPPSLHALDQNDMVIRVGSFSMILTPGIRLGYIIAPRRIVRDLATLKRISAGPTDAITQRAICELLLNGVIDDHLETLRREHQQRYQSLARTLSNSEIRHVAPYGGMYVWLRLPPEKTQLAKSGITHGSRFYPAPYVSPHVRLSLASPHENALSTLAA